jgi:hypothetical protein
MGQLTLGASDSITVDPISPNAPAGSVVKEAAAPCEAQDGTESGARLQAYDNIDTQSVLY